MIKIRVPATSANLGIGFDCLGIAFDLYNTFTVEQSDSLQFENIDEKYCNENNLFVQSYRASGGTNIRVRLDGDIPVSRGLGSSASLIVGGIAAYQALHGGLTDKQMLEIATKLEGHPDNAAPALMGGLIGCLNTGEEILTKSFNVHPSYCFTVCIPDFEVSTPLARSVLPDNYPRSVAANSSACALFTMDALASGNMELLKKACVDEIHEPYRKKLIDEFEDLQAITEADTDGKLLISGSGSTCLYISKQSLSAKALDKISCLKHHWKTITVHACHGVEIWNENKQTWVSMIQ